MMPVPNDCPDAIGLGANSPEAPSKIKPHTMTAAIALAGIPPVERYLYRQKEAASFLGVSRATLMRWVAQRALPVHRLCKVLHFRREDLIRFADSRRRAPRDDRPYARSGDQA